MDFLHRNPFVRLLLPLVLGILMGNLFSTPPCWVLLVLIALASVGFLLHILALHFSHFFRFRGLFGFAVALFLMASGWWLTMRAYAITNIDFADKKATFCVEILDTPEEKPKSVLCKVAVRQQFDSLYTQKQQGIALLYIAKDTNALALQRGDILLINTTFSVPIDNGNPENFDYATYLKRKGIAATAYISTENWQKLAHNSTFSLVAIAHKCQQHLLSIYRQYNIQEPEFGVLAALTLGYKDSLEPELQASFAASGAMHILAVSGLHVGIIYVIIGALLSFLNRLPYGKPLKAVLIVLFLWSYAFITGLSPSVLRATLMFSFVCIGQSLERRSQTYNTIALSAFILLIYNPLLLFSVGFQLSYSAVVAIIYFQPKIKKLVYFRSRPMKWLWDLLSVSIAAQLGTAPWALFYFHQFSNYFLLTNILAIPMASVIIYTAIALLLLSPLPFLAKWIALGLRGEVWFLNFGVINIEHLPFSVSTVWISVEQTILLFAFVFLIAIFMEQKKAIWLASASVCLLLCCGLHFFRHCQTLDTERLVVYADRKTNVVQHCNGKSNVIFTNDKNGAEYLERVFRLKERLNQPLVTLLDSAHSTMFQVRNERYLLITNDILHRKTINASLQVDHLLLGDIGKTQPEEILTIIQPKRVVALASLSSWKCAALRQLCEEQGICFYSVSEQGALIESWKKETIFESRQNLLKTKFPHLYNAIFLNACKQVR